MNADLDAKWKFVAEADACELCQYYHGETFKTSEIWEEFPYATPLFDDVIEPNIHPNCRCQLRLVPSPGGDEITRSKRLLADPRLLMGKR